MIVHLTGALTVSKTRESGNDLTAGQNPPSLRARLVVACAVALVAGVIAWYKSRHGDLFDFPHYWNAGRALLDGTDPYPSFVYPLPAAMWAAPFALFSPAVGGGLFVGSAFGFVTFGLTANGWHRLPILVSGPALWCLHIGQWTPLVVAAALMPAFAWAAVAKPTIGFAAFARQPSWTFVWVGAGTLLLSFLVMPDWPFRWWAATHKAEGAHWTIPVLQPFGWLLLLSVLRWRTPDGRMLLALSVLPQGMVIYDQFPLLLLARTRTEAITFALWSQVVPMGVGFLTIPKGLSAADGVAATFPFWARVVMFTLFLPALAVVLWRKGEPRSIPVA